MNQTPYILMIAPAAPPRKSPESIQVGRILSALDAHARGRLVTLAPEERGWAKADASLATPLTHFDREELMLPLHPLLQRVLSSHRFSRLHVPDAMFWITWETIPIVRRLPQKPEVIYSRSSPMSAAVLARKLKQMLGVPWIMHLSDPWVDSPYKTASARERRLEAECFATADAVSVTTEMQARFYRDKYPMYAAKLFVSPNMLPPETPASLPKNEGPLRLVYAGNFYGDRSPAPLIHALHSLSGARPDLSAQLQINMYGQAQGHCLAQLQQAGALLTYHGPVSYAQASAATVAADMVLSLEPALDHPLAAGFLPSKVLDCIGLGKPLFALTPAGSETAQLCAMGYGRAVAPNNPEAILTALIEAVESRATLRQTPPKAPPERYRAQAVAAEFLEVIARVRVA